MMSEDTESVPMTGVMFATDTARDAYVSLRSAGSMANEPAMCHSCGVPPALAYGEGVVIGSSCVVPPTLAYGEGVVIGSGAKMKLDV